MNEPLPITRSITIPAAELEFEFSRSGGPGGQHVNTTDTRVRLRFALDHSSVLTDAVKQRLKSAHPSWVTAEGELIITADGHRSRHRNIEDTRARLAEAIRTALVPPKKRKKTRPSRRAMQRRLDAKKRRSQVKEGRKKVDPNH